MRRVAVTGTGAVTPLGLDVPSTWRAAQAGEAWRATNLVFCHENGTAYTSDALNWRFSKMTSARWK